IEHRASSIEHRASSIEWAGGAMMSLVPTIRVLSDSLVNRIAAGEVVERPASVVKELVENSLDADARRIEVELVAGGRSLVRVTDDGCGMDPDDALLALERHATSKIGTDEDLLHIGTLGFRGEALPSIAAVSRFQILTAEDPAKGGVRVTVEGGRILGAEAAARARGTTIEVRDLFFNVPARRKFLRAPETELRHAQETLWGAALARPGVAFVLRHANRTLIDAPVVADASRRLKDLWRRADQITRFEAKGAGGEVEGLVAPGGGRGRPTLTLLVNGRPVRDRLLVGAVLRVLRGGGSGFGGARVVIDLRLPPDHVDVNVHPAKAEVRFAHAGAVFALIERAVRQGVAASQGRVAVSQLDEGEPEGTGVAERGGGGYGELVRGRLPGGAPLFAHPAYDVDPEVGVDGTAERLDAPISGHHAAKRSGARSGPADTPFGRLIGQYRESFLLLEDGHGLVIVDQHVAHERVLYDRILRRLAEGEAPSQRLLTPRLLELGEAMTAAVTMVEELLRRVGIEAEVFGPDTIKVSSVPPELEPEAVDQVVEEILDRATALDGVPERAAEELSEEIAASLSCRGAIKVNHQLSRQEQKALLEDLVTTDNPYRCPHGRPIILRLSQEEMERRLGRR
ncbi:MAG: DNA mismatch repair endonuclease MutL, partial [Acidobacteriota bacterium]|nr:DNA mismatch repair endonuclease MutL [Acidobacteriota bacterium]